MVPLKKWPKFSSWAFLSMMTWGVLVSALVVAFVTGTFNLSPVGFFCGLWWVIGGTFCFWAVKAEADLAGAGVRSMGMSILASFLSGVLLFHEKSSFALSIPAIILRSEVLPVPFGAIRAILSPSLTLRLMFSKRIFGP